MEDDELLEQTSFVPGGDEKRALRPYDLLLRQSRKMGSLATKAYGATVSFLTTDIAAFGADYARAKARGMVKADTMDVARHSREVLAAARTLILPQNLFPDSVILDRTKLTIIKRTFFWTAETISIRVEDILNVTSTYGPFFGSIIISSRIMNSTDHYEIDGFWRRDAIYLKEIIQGYMIAMHNNINVKDLDRQDLVATLLELGRDSRI